MGSQSKDYFAYLQTYHWRQLRAWLNLRCSGRCEACDHDTNAPGSPWKFDGHHLVYRTPLCTGQLSDLLGLCRRCHDIVHDLDIPILFQHGTPIDDRRARTLLEIRRYLPELNPRDTRIMRIPLPPTVLVLKGNRLVKQPVSHQKIKQIEKMRRLWRETWKDTKSPRNIRTLRRR